MCDVTNQDQRQDLADDGRPDDVRRQAVGMTCHESLDIRLVGLSADYGRAPGERRVDQLYAELADVDVQGVVQHVHVEDVRGSTRLADHDTATRPDAVVINISDSTDNPEEN